MKIKILVIFLTCVVFNTNSRKILPNLSNGKLTENVLFTRELRYQKVMSLIDFVRSFSPYQIIKLARLVDKGEISPKILTIVTSLKPLTPSQLQIIQKEGNNNKLPENLIDNLNYLLLLNDTEIQKINDLKDLQYLAIILKNSTKEKYQRYAFYLNTTNENNSIKIINLFYHIDLTKLETIIILSDMKILPSNILDHIEIIKSMDDHDFYQSIQNIKLSPKKIEKALNEIQSYDLDQVDLILKFANLNSNQLNFLYSLAFLNLIPTEQLNIIIYQFNLNNNIRNIIDLLVEFKTLPKEKFEHIKSFSQTGLVSTIIVLVFDHLEKISLEEMHYLIYDFNLGTKLSKYLSPLITSKIQNLVKMLRKFDHAKLKKLSEYVKDGIMSEYLITAASIIASLSQSQVENIIKQTNLNQLPKYVLDMLEFFRKLPNAELELLSSLNNAKLNIFSILNQTFSRTQTKKNQYLTKINGCFESKSVTVITTKTFVPIHESEKCATIL